MRVSAAVWGVTGTTMRGRVHVVEESNANKSCFRRLNDQLYFTEKTIRNRIVFFMLSLQHISRTRLQTFLFC